MSSITTVKALFAWMEKNLNPQAYFSYDDLRHFFAESFQIKTNSRVVDATPETYREYLYSLKNTLQSVKYQIEDMFEAHNKVVASFVIELNFTQKKPIQLQTISIFKLDKDHRIVEWKEVFADAGLQKFEYDVT